MENLKCVINRDSDVGTFLHVKTMVEELYSDNSKYHNCLVILGYNLGKEINFYREKYPNKKIIVYQLEQLFNYNPNWFNPNSNSKHVKHRTSHIKKWLDECDEIWEYDLSNKWFLETLGYNKVKFVPLKYSKSLENIKVNQNPKYDILFYGAINKKRFEILKKINSKFNLVVIGDNFDVDNVELNNSGIKFLPKDFSDKLDNIISETKIILNLHFYESSIQEQVRLFYLLNNSKCVVSELSKKNYYGDLIHEFENYETLEKKLTELLTNNKWLDFSRTISHRFKTKQFNNLKVGVSYNSFYNVDVLKKSIESIINVVDYICVVHQKKSFSGEIGSIENNILLQELVDCGYIDELVLYDEDVVDKIIGMIDKRNVGLSKCKNANCDYILTLDNDECYNDRYVTDEIKFMNENGIDTLYSPIVSYYKSDKYYFVEDKLYVPSIYKIDERKYGRHISSSVLSDPARKMPEKKYYISQMYMHHLTYLENNFKEKLNSKILFSVDNNKKSFSHQILENLINWIPGNKGLVIGNNDKNENILVLKDLLTLNKMVNEFDIKNNKKDISIIIPTYNVLNYLTECLDSVLTSIKDLNVEILVGIDGCKKTLSYIQDSKFDPRIRFYYFNQNVGPYIVKNSLSLISNSDYLMFFDSDDIMKEELVQDIIRYKSTHKLIKPMYIDFNEEVKNINLEKSNANTYGEGVFGIEKKLFLDMNGFEGWRCAADSDLMNRLYKNNVKLIHTKSLGFYRRVHKNSLTQHPDTNLSSQMRGKYYNLSKKRKTFGPIENLVTESFYEIFNKKIIDEEYEKFIINKQKIDTLLTDVIKLNVKPKNSDSKINYDLINQVLNRTDIYHPSKNVKPVREHVPNDRNKLIEIKKGTLAAQNREFFPQKRKRDDSNNPFSRKNKY